MVAALPALLLLALLVPLPLPALPPLPALLPGDYVYSGDRLTLGGADSTGQMYAAAATIATTFSNSIEGLMVDATTSSGSNENALKVQTGDIELGMCSGDAAAAAVAGTGKFCRRWRLRGSARSGRCLRLHVQLGCPEVQRLHLPA